jgi:SCP-2 sterol transfer family
MPFADAYPSSEAFDAINAALQASEAERKDAIKQGNAVFAFTLKNKAGETESWHIDLKNKGAVGKGLGEKPTGRLLLCLETQLLLPRPVEDIHRALARGMLFCADAWLTFFRHSYPITLRRRLRQVGCRQSERATIVHGRQTEGQGRRDEGHKDGANSQEGPGGEGEAIDIPLTLYNTILNLKTFPLLVL